MRAAYRGFAYYIGGRYHLAHPDDRQQVKNRYKPIKRYSDYPTTPFSKESWDKLDAVLGAFEELMGDKNEPSKTDQPKEVSDRIRILWDRVYGNTQDRKDLSPQQMINKTLQCIVVGQLPDEFAQLLRQGTDGARELVHEFLREHGLAVTI